MENIKELGTYFGLNKEDISSFDIIDLTRKGLKAKFAEKLRKDIHLSQEEFADSLPLKLRTLTRRLEEKNKPFNPDESVKLVRMGRVYLESMIVFKDQKKAAEWLKRDNRALQGKPPLSFLDSDVGAEEVLTILGRIKHGIFS